MYYFVIVGYGEIARKAHTTALLGRSAGDCRIVAIVDTRDVEILHIPPDLSHIPIYKTLARAVRNHPEINVASICTPPLATMDLAYEAVETFGLHVLLEKPPGDYTRLPKLQELATHRDNPLTVFTANHSTAPPGLPHILEWIQTMHANNNSEDSGIAHIYVEWKEDVRKWHPNQEWVTTRQGMGVLDMAFNPISLLVKVLPSAVPLVLEEAALVRPSNWESPIAGTIKMRSGNILIHAAFDWRYQANYDEPEEVWTMTFTAHSNKWEDDNAPVRVMRIQDGGAQVYINDKRVTTEPTAEYSIGPEYVNLYETFVQLMNIKACYVDTTTPRLIEEILERATWTISAEYDICVKETPS